MGWMPTLKSDWSGDQKLTAEVISTPRVTCGVRTRTPVRGERAARRQVQAIVRCPTEYQHYVIAPRLYSVLTTGCDVVN